MINIVHEEREGRYVEWMNSFNKKQFLKREWLEDENVKAILWDICHIRVHGTVVLEDEFFGQMGLEDIPSGLAVLIMLLKSDKDIIIQSASMGPNCFKWLAKISQMNTSSNVKLFTNFCWELVGGVDLDTKFCFQNLDSAPGVEQNITYREFIKYMHGNRYW